MKENRVLATYEAEAVVENLIEQFGLSALPKIRVVELANGAWQVRWMDQERTLEPMTRDAWHHWLELNIGSLEPGDLETTEG